MAHPCSCVAWISIFQSEGNWFRPWAGHFCCGLDNPTPLFQVQKLPAKDWCVFVIHAIPKKTGRLPLHLHNSWGKNMDKQGLYSTLILVKSRFYLKLYFQIVAYLGTDDPKYCPVMLMKVGDLLLHSTSCQRNRFLKIFSILKNSTKSNI